MTGCENIFRTRAMVGIDDAGRACRWYIDGIRPTRAAWRMPGGWSLERRSQQSVIPRVRRAERGATCTRNPTPHTSQRCGSVERSSSPPSIFGCVPEQIDTLLLFLRARSCNPSGDLELIFKQSGNPPVDQRPQPQHSCDIAPERNAGRAVVFVDRNSAGRSVQLDST